jgi:hypothetical protein
MGLRAQRLTPVIPLAFTRKGFVPLILLAFALWSAGCGGNGDERGEKRDPNPEIKGFHVAPNANRFAGPAPLRVRFTADDFKASGNVEYRWRFDDGTTSREQNPTHTFKAGTYNVELHARDERASDSWNVVIGSWPPDVWAATRNRVAKPRELRAQGHRTARRRKELEQASLRRTRW